MPWINEHLSIQVQFYIIRLSSSRNLSGGDVPIVFSLLICHSFSISLSHFLPLRPSFIPLSQYHTLVYHLMSVAAEIGDYSSSLQPCVCVSMHAFGFTGEPEGGPSSQNSQGSLLRAIQPRLHHYQTGCVCAQRRVGAMLTGSVLCRVPPQCFSLTSTNPSFQKRNIKLTR